MGPARGAAHREGRQIMRGPRTIFQWGRGLALLALLGGLLPGASRAQGLPNDLGDEMRVVSQPGGQITALHLAGRYLVWSVVTAQAVPVPPPPAPGTPPPYQRPAPPEQHADIWLADLGVAPPQVQRLAGPLPPTTRVSLAGSRVVWSEPGSSGSVTIVGRDVATAAPLTAPPAPGNQFLPAISGDWVIWSGSPNQSGAGIPEAQAIGAWNLRTGETRTLDTYWLEPDPQIGPAPAVDPNGTQVAYIVRPFDSTQTALRVYDFATGKARTVRTFPEETHRYSNLQIAGGWAVWEEPVVGPGGAAASRIVQVDLASGKPVVRAELARAGTLAAGAGLIAWRELADDAPLLAAPLNPLLDSAIRSLTPPQARPSGPATLSAGGVAWVDGRDPAAPAIYVRQAGGTPPAADPFTRLWTRTDEPVAAGRVQRSWVWGPRPEGLLARDQQEPYAEAPGLQRLVRYYDKGRMEINDPGANLAAPWAVTSGLLVVEMITGRVATGNTAARAVAPNTVPVAGDPDSPAAPAYAALAGALINPLSARPLPGPRSGEPVTTWMDAAGTQSEHAAPALVRYAAYDETAHHNIPDVFLQFMNARGPVNVGGTYREEAIFDPLFTFGYPVIEPVWITIRVGGQDRAVLFQAFERRTLTYTPTNPPAWQVEMGNVGAHYYAWRYER